MTSAPPPNTDATGTPRWFTEHPDGHSARYVERFRGLTRDGVDIVGEARLVDAMLGRNSRVLDAGCGPGRIGAELHARGHEVVGVDVDPELIAAAVQDYPGPTWITADLASLDLGTTFDAIVLAGNVLVFVVPGSERNVLERMAAHLRPDGFAVAGFATDRTYTVRNLDRDAAAAGLVFEHRFATWDLRPWRHDAGWAVSVFRRSA